MVTPIDRNKVNPPESTTYAVGDMNVRHSMVYGAKHFFVILAERKIATKISTATIILKNEE